MAEEETGKGLGELERLREESRVLAEEKGRAWAEWVRLQDEHRRALGKISDYLNAHPEDADAPTP